MGGMAIAFIITFASCNKDLDKKQTPAPQSETSLKDMISENGNNPDEAMLSENGSADASLAKGKSSSQGGYVYTESNDAAGNKILIYDQNADGTLSWNSSVASGGTGSGAGLGSQGAVALDEQHKWLYAVNAGDNSVSSFWVHNDGSLTLADTKNSGGTLPISVCVYNDLLYVVNSGSDNICGFKVDVNGMLTKINGSSQALSGMGTGPAQIAFHPGGKMLFVTEKNTNIISSFKLNAQGVAAAGVFNSSVGKTPFGFDFARNNNSFLIVSDAEGGGVNAGACTSYSSDKWGITNAVNGAIPNYQSAPCWVATTHYGRFAFVTNTGSNSISSYYVSPFGGLYLVFFTVTPAGEAPIDITVSGNNRFVYNINSMSHTITEYRRGLLGTLNHIGKVSNLPSYASGLAAF